MIWNILEKETNIYEVAISIKFKIIRNWPRRCFTLQVNIHCCSQDILVSGEPQYAPTSADFKVSFLNPAFLFLFSVPVLLHSTSRFQSVSERACPSPKTLNIFRRILFIVFPENTEIPFLCPNWNVGNTKLEDDCYHTTMSPNDKTVLRTQFRNYEDN